MRRIGLEWMMVLLRNREQPLDYRATVSRKRNSRTKTIGRAQIVTNPNNNN